MKGAITVLEEVIKTGKPKTIVFETHQIASKERNKFAMLLDNKQSLHNKVRLHLDDNQITITKVLEEKA